MSEASETRAARPPRDGTPLFELSRLMAVAIIGPLSRIQARAQVAPDGAWEGGWEPVDPDTPYDLMTAGITGDGRVAVVGQRQSDNALFYIDETADGVGQQSWNKPVNLMRPNTQGAFVAVSMAYDADGRVEIFGADGAGQVYWGYQNPDRIVTKDVTITPPGTTTPITVQVEERAPPETPWSTWTSLGGAVLNFLKAVRNGDGRIVLFGIDEALQLWRNEQKTASALQPSDWSGWTPMTTEASGPIAIVAPAMDANSAVNLFCVTSTGGVMQSWQQPAASAQWTEWISVGPLPGGAQALAANVDADGHILLVATGTDRTHYQNIQSSVFPQQWTGWQAFSATDYPVQTALDYNADGRLTLFSHWLLPPGQYGGLWCLSQTAPDSTRWEGTWTELAPGDTVQYAVVRDLTPPAN